MPTETAIPAVRTTVRLESPYPQGEGLQWLKGNLHVHTTRSDVENAPQEVIQRYADLGYDFLMLSDHDQPADLAGLDPCGLVLLPGNEVSSGGPHLLDVGARFTATERDDRQAVIDDINRNGGFAVLCHPNWQADY